MSSTQKRLPTCRTIETTINRDIIVSQVAAFLYAASIVHDDEHIQNIQFGELFGASDTELVPIKIELKKKQRVEVIRHGST